jgi:hypothetical protein
MGRGKYSSKGPIYYQQQSMDGMRAEHHMHELTALLVLFGNGQPQE